MLAPPGKPVGRMLVPRSRNLVRDVLWLHQDVPTCVHHREMNLASVSAARSALSERVSWPAVFLKAYGAICARHPKLLQTWRRWPVSHLFQHSSPVASVAVHRRYQNDDWLLWGKIRDPHLQSLLALQAALDRFTDEPVEEVFRQELQLAMLPTFLRRLIWWCNLNLYGEKRIKRTGSFLLTTLAGRGADNPHPPSFLTSTISYAPLRADGSCQVSIIYDHRLMDGAFVADRLMELEVELNEVILADLQAMASTNRDRNAA